MDGDGVRWEGGYLTGARLLVCHERRGERTQLGGNWGGGKKPLVIMYLRTFGTLPCHTVQAPSTWTVLPGLLA